MALDLKTLPGPIDPTDPLYTSLLANLQGNILKSHGRNRTVNLFLRFAPGKETEVQNWIGCFTRRYVTSALRQQQEAREFKENGISGGIFATLSLSAKGYEYLGVDLTVFREEKLPHPLLTTDCLFKKGMKDAQSELNDPDPRTWEFNQPDNDIHAVILLADEQLKRLEDVQARILADINSKGGILEVPPVIIQGVALRDERNQPLEHFGYRDGVSQPLFFLQDVAEEAARFGISDWDPSAPLSQVLIPDPLTDKPDSFGSYFVFRKLKQNVAGFLNAEEALAKTLGLAGTLAEERAGALAVGRFENGIPVTVNGSEQGDKYRDFNNFNYHDDQEGARCPFQSHIRKTNPRGDTARKLLVPGGLPDNITDVLGLPPLPPTPPVEVTDAIERMRRITRRGITFGIRFTSHLDDCGKIIKENGKAKWFDDGEGQLIRPKLVKDGNLHPPIKGDVGLLFQCYQSSIPNQFGFMQKNWANLTDFAAPATGIDPVIGQLPGGFTGAAGQEAFNRDNLNSIITDNDGNPLTHPIEHSWPKEYDNPASLKERFDFDGFVQMQGGEFFFTPSIAYLMQFGESIPSEAADRVENQKRTSCPETASS